MPDDCTLVTGLHEIGEALLADLGSSRLVAAYLRSKQDGVDEFLLGGAAPRSAIPGIRRAADPAPHVCSVTRRLDALALRGFDTEAVASAVPEIDVLADFEAAASGAQTTTTRLVRAAAVIAQNRLRKSTGDAAVADAAAARGAVATYRWHGVNIDDPASVPLAAGCLRERGYPTCRCSAGCTRISNQRHKERRLAEDAGYVPAAAAQAKVQALLFEGHSLRDIADTAGVSIGSVRDLAGSVREQITAAVSDAITGIESSRMRTVNRAESYAPSYRVFRRLDALLCQGWTIEMLSASVAEATGLSIGRLFYRRQKRFFEQQVLDAVDAFYRSHIGQRGPSSITIARARTAGRLPDIVWDNIDDPREEPQISSIVDPAHRKAARTAWRKGTHERAGAMARVA